MKVTKLIREYVTESVDKAIPITNLCPEYDVARANADTICKILKDEMGDFYAKRVKELMVTYPIPEDFEMSHSYSVTYYPYRSKLKKQHDQILDEAKCKREKKIKEILVSLELGANRDELNRMIESLVKTEE